MQLPLGFRSLYNELLRNGDADAKILHERHAEVQLLMDRLRPYGEPEARHLRTGNHPNINKQMLLDIWELYALSRVNDLLILPYQSDCDDAAGWKGPNVGKEEYVAFMTSLGMYPIKQDSFHSIYHEIVEVEQSPDNNEPISITKVLWPGFMLGSLVFSRAGVNVRGGAKYVNKEIAEKSTLYWAFRRSYRPVSDLSHGWGSNSQWRTAFRRDYVFKNQVFYNVDGKLDARFPNSVSNSKNPAREELTPSERVELLSNRCFIMTQKPHYDLWPFDDFYIEPK
jgi:hypothetical protein